MKTVDFSTLNKAEISKTLRSLLIHSGVDLTLTLVFGESPKKPRSWVFEREFLLNRLAPLNQYTAPILKGYTEAASIFKMTTKKNYYLFSLLPLVEPPFTTEQAEDLVNLCNIKMQGDKAEKSESEQMKYSELETTDFGIWSLVKGNF